MDYEEFSEQFEESVEGTADAVENGDYSKAIIIVAGIAATAITVVGYELYRGLRSSKMDTAKQLKFYKNRRDKYIKKVLEERISESQK